MRLQEIGKATKRTVERPVVAGVVVGRSGKWSAVAAVVAVTSGGAVGASVIVTVDDGNVLMIQLQIIDEKAVVSVFVFSLIEGINGALDDLMPLVLVCEKIAIVNEDGMHMAVPNAIGVKSVGMGETAMNQLSDTASAPDALGLTVEKTVSGRNQFMKTDLSKIVANKPTNVMVVENVKTIDQSQWNCTVSAKPVGIEKISAGNDPHCEGRLLHNHMQTASNSMHDALGSMSMANGSSVLGVILVDHVPNCVQVVSMHQFCVNVKKAATPPIDGELNYGSGPDFIAVVIVANKVKSSKDVGMITHLTGAASGVNFGDILSNSNKHTYGTLSNHLDVIVMSSEYPRGKLRNVNSGDCVEISSHHKVVMDVGQSNNTPELTHQETIKMVEHVDAMTYDRSLSRAASLDSVLENGEFVGPMHMKIWKGQIMVRVDVLEVMAVVDGIALRLAMLNDDMSEDGAIHMASPNAKLMQVVPDEVAKNYKDDVNVLGDNNPHMNDNLSVIADHKIAAILLQGGMMMSDLQIVVHSQKLITISLALKTMAMKIRLDDNENYVNDLAQAQSKQDGEDHVNGLVISNVVGNRIYEPMAFVGFEGYIHLALEAKAEGHDLKADKIDSKSQGPIVQLGVPMAINMFLHAIPFVLDAKAMKAAQGYVVNLDPGPNSKRADSMDVNVGKRVDAIGPVNNGSIMIALKDEPIVSGVSVMAGPGNGDSKPRALIGVDNPAHMPEVLEDIEKFVVGRKHDNDKAIAKAMALRMDVAALHEHGENDLD